MFARRCKQCGGPMTLAGALRELSNDRFHCPSCGQQYVCKHAYLVILFLALIMATAVSSLISMVVVHATIQCEDCANWSDIVFYATLLPAFWASNFMLLSCQLDKKAG